VGNNELESDEMLSFFLSSAWHWNLRTLLWETGECTPSPLGVVCLLLRSCMLTLCVRLWQLCIQMRLN